VNTDQGRVGTGPVGRTEQAGFYRFKIFFIQKVPLGPPQALLGNELDKFLDMEFFLSKLCRVQVQVQLMLLQ
jgi:hypothetical protein